MTYSRNQKPQQSQAMSAVRSMRLFAIYFMNTQNDNVSDSPESHERQREVEFQKWAESSRLKTEDAMRLLECEIVFDHHLEGTFHEKQRVQGMLSLWKSLGYPTIQSLRELVEFSSEVDVMFSANDQGEARPHEQPERKDYE
jgi:hypothetical protein